MLWTFTRGRRQLSCEIRLALLGPGYELVVRHPDGSARLERFYDTTTLNQRTLELQRHFLSDGWHSARPR